MSLVPVDKRSWPRNIKARRGRFTTMPNLVANKCFSGRDGSTDARRKRARSFRGFDKSAAILILEWSFPLCYRVHKLRDLFPTRCCSRATKRARNGGVGFREFSTTPREIERYAISCSFLFFSSSSLPCSCLTLYRLLLPDLSSAVFVGIGLGPVSGWLVTERATTTKGNPYV